MLHVSLSRCTTRTHARANTTIRETETSLGVLNEKEHLYLFACANHTYEIREFFNYSSDFTGIALRTQEIINLIYHVIKQRERYAKDGPYALELPYTLLT